MFQAPPRDGTIWQWPGSQSLLDLFEDGWNQLEHPQKKSHVFPPLFGDKMIENVINHDKHHPFPVPLQLGKPMFDGMLLSGCQRFSKGGYHSTTTSTSMMENERITNSEAQTASLGSILKSKTWTSWTKHLLEGSRIMPRCFPAVDICTLKNRGISSSHP